MLHNLYFAVVQGSEPRPMCQCETVACNRVTCHDGTSRCIFSMESASNITAITHTGLEALAAAFAAKKTRVLRCSTRYFAVVHQVKGISVVAWPLHRSALQRFRESFGSIIERRNRFGFVVAQPDSAEWREGHGVPVGRPVSPLGCVAP